MNMTQLKFCELGYSDILSRETTIRGRISRNFNKIFLFDINSDNDWAKFERGAHFVTQSLRSWTKWQKLNLWAIGC
jgi:hypothetical protein